MNDQQPLEREQPTIKRGEGILGDQTIISGYGHTLTLDRARRVLIRLDAASFYRDPEFVKWLNDEKDGPATWHRRRGDEPSEFSDVFIHYGGADWKGERFNAEGSDYPNLPTHPGIPAAIYALIAEAVAEATGSMDTEALVWISNLN